METWLNVHIGKGPSNPLEGSTGLENTPNAK